jgi:GH24 family phage-related lysozyme (muramidase)
MTTPTLSLSKEGARFLEAEEGVRLVPYEDTRGIATIGVGHAYEPQGAITEAQLKPGLQIIPGVVTGAGGSITLAEALTLEQHDVDVNAIQALRVSLKVSLDIAQPDALCSLGFNCGPGSLAADGAVMKAVNSKPKAAPVGSTELAEWHARVTAAFMLWANPSVLTRRRLGEGHLFATGQYTRATGNPYAPF